MTWLPHALHRLQRAMLLSGEAVTDSVVDRADGMMESLLPQLPGSTPKSSGQGAADVTGEAGLNGGIKFLSGPRTRFTLQNQGDQKTYGPYEFRQGAVVGSERYPYSLQIVDDDTFQLTSPDVATPLGPFELRVGAVVTMPKATFTVMAIMQD